MSHSSRSPYGLLLRALAASFALSLATVSFERTALADGEPADAQSACISAYESLQEARARGDLLTAREQAFECASSACPSFMQADCSGWLEEIETEVPSVSFEVRSGGKAVGAVRVLEGDRVLAERLEGASVELDPGTHWLTFEAEGLEPVTKPIVVERGTKNQRFSVELPAPKPDNESVPVVPPRVPSTESSSSPAPWIAGGIGVAGMTAFGILAVTGRAQEASLERTCAPACTEADMRSVETKYLLADISLGVGITGILVSGYLLLAPESEKKTSAALPSLHVRATANGAMASVGSEF